MMGLRRISNVSALALLLVAACETVDPDVAGPAPSQDSPAPGDTSGEAAGPSPGPSTVAEKLADTGVKATIAKRALFDPASTACFPRQTQPSSAIVDGLVYPRPLAGPGQPLSKTADMLSRAGILFAALSGTGRSADAERSCDDPQACDALPAPRVLKHDFANAADLVGGAAGDLTVTPAMAFGDLTRPQTIPARLGLLETEYPGLFKALGPLDLANGVLLPRGVEPVAPDAIIQWAPFMEALRDRSLPLLLTADLGTDEAPTVFLPLLEEVLTRYPDNRIVWVGLGLSDALTTFDPADHVALVSALMTRHRNLYGLLTGSGLFAVGFSDPEPRALYLDFMGRFAERLVPATGFTASAGADIADYRRRLMRWAEVFMDLDDEAFRAIALGGTYFTLFGLPNRAPKVCTQTL
ncbi:MAG: hypothetical protein ACFB6R_14465 [Alphaproteobacteria bacterium]